MFFVVELRGMFMKNNDVMPYIDKSHKKVFEMNWCWWEVKFLHGVFMNISFFFMHWCNKYDLKWTAVCGRYQHMILALNWFSPFFSVSMVTDPCPQPRFAGRFGPTYHKPSGRQFVRGAPIHCHGNLHRRVSRMLSHHDLHEGKI